MAIRIGANEHANQRIGPRQLVKVLHLESGRHLYGGAVQVLLLLRGLHAEGVKNVLVCPGGSAIASARPDAELREIPMGGDLDIGMISRVRRIIAETNPDIIHLHSRRGADWLGGLASLRLGIPVVLTRRVDNPESHWIAAAKYALVDHVIAISQAIRQILIAAGISAGKVTCVPDAVPPKEACQRDRQWFHREFGVAVEAPVIGVIAQLIPRKGHLIFLDAIPGLLRSTPDLRVIFFGRGESEKVLRDQITALGLEDVVSMPGFRNDIPRLLPCLDMVVHPALTEGLGVALLQASQAGLPVVASRIGGIPEAIIDGQTGLLVAPGDVSALALAVSSLLADPACARRFGDAGVAHISNHFSLERMVAGNMSVYGTVRPQLTATL